MKLLYPTSLALEPQRLEGFGVTLHPYDVHALLPALHHDADIMVTWGNSPEMLRDAAQKLKNLRWIQSLAAGPNDVFAAGFSPQLIVTSGSGLHDHTVAEHTLGMLLNAARRFYEMRDLQLQRTWPTHLGGLQPDRPKDAFRTLEDANILIWGFGNIARALTPHLLALKANVRGVARSKGIRNGIEIFTPEALPTLLPQTDALVMILPGAAETDHALGEAQLKLLPDHAWVVNVGRGNAIDEDALNRALRAGELGGAALDVFSQEPLPLSSPLWDAPNLLMSPHAAGARPQGAEALIGKNLRRFQAGQPLLNTMTR